MRNSQLRSITLTAIMAGFISIASLLSIPSPAGVPVTLQTFAICLSASLLGWKRGVLCVLVYLLMGAFGLPVFANGKAGFPVLFSLTGGFLFGFLPFALFCGIDASSNTVKYALSMLGLAVCHTLGVLQFSLITKRTIAEAFALASMPYLIKDILSIVSASILAKIIKKHLRTEHQ